MIKTVLLYPYHNLDILDQINYNNNFRPILNNVVKNYLEKMLVFKCGFYINK